MHDFKYFVEKYNIDNQLPHYNIIATEKSLVVDGQDYRLSVYGWPDNKILGANKITGENFIKRFGPKGKNECERNLKNYLGVLGVDFLDGESDLSILDLEIMSEE
jgi:hypothetical protein